MEQKYIINDIVMYDNKIMVIKEPRDGIHFDLSCPKEGLTYCFVNVNEIKPVRLTIAILEKNGWSREDGVLAYLPIPRRLLMIRHERNYIACLSVFPFYDNDGFSFLYNNQKLATIHYIHELQHIIYGLKINLEMEV